MDQRTKIRQERDALFARGKKKCSKCQKIKSVEVFPLNRATRDGHNSYCQPCYAAYGKGWRGKNAGYKRLKNAEWYEQNRERIAAATRKHRVTSWVWQKTKNTKYWCDQKGVAFDLHEGDNITRLEERYAKGLCEMTGFPFRLVPGGRDWDTPSIDRIDPSKGYTYDNVRLVLWIMNVSMSNWGEDRLHTVMTKWLSTRL